MLGGIARISLEGFSPPPRRSDRVSMAIEDEPTVSATAFPLLEGEPSVEGFLLPEHVERALRLAARESASHLEEAPPSTLRPNVELRILVDEHVARRRI